MSECRRLNNVYLLLFYDQQSPAQAQQKALHDLRPQQGVEGSPPGHESICIIKNYHSSINS